MKQKIRKIFLNIYFKNNCDFTKSEERDRGRKKFNHGNAKTTNENGSRDFPQ